MSLGNLHQNPNDPSTVIQTGCANAPYTPTTRDTVLYYLAAATMVASIFLNKPNEPTVVSGEHENTASPVIKANDTVSGRSASSVLHLKL